MIVGCDACGALFRSEPSDRCPACAGGPLTPADGQAPPIERVVPRAVDRAALRGRFDAAVREVWFRCPELDPELLASRAVPVWWPYWLVDVHAEGKWEIEAGFDYPVASTQEVFQAGRWVSRQVTETRTRWEPRVGAIDRAYPNLPVPGSADTERRERALGAFPLDDARAPSPDDLSAPVRLPDRTTAEQWPVALGALRERVAADCARAAGADHARGLVLDVGGTEGAWTLLVVPGFTSWYTDDQGERHVLEVHGQTGRVGGPLFASEAAGRRAATVWFAIGGSIGALGAAMCVVGLVLWPLLPFAAAAVFLGACVALVGVVPWFAPARHNLTVRSVTDS